MDHFLLVSNVCLTGILIYQRDFFTHCKSQEKPPLSPLLRRGSRCVFSLSPSSHCVYMEHLCGLKGGCEQDSVHSGKETQGSWSPGCFCTSHTLVGSARLPGHKAQGITSCRREPNSASLGRASGSPGQLHGGKRLRRPRNPAPSSVSARAGELWGAPDRVRCSGDPSSHKREESSVYGYMDTGQGQGSWRGQDPRDRSGRGSSSGPGPGFLQGVASSAKCELTFLTHSLELYNLQGAL